jgi:hypothetical protein
VLVVIATRKCASDMADHRRLDREAMPGQDICLICEPTMGCTGHSLLFAVANSKLWRVSQDIVESVAPVVERARHNEHGQRGKKVTHPDILIQLSMMTSVTKKQSRRTSN